MAHTWLFELNTLCNQIRVSALACDPAFHPDMPNQQQLALLIRTKMLCRYHNADADAFMLRFSGFNVADADV